MKVVENRIVVKNLTKRFRNEIAIKNISFELDGVGPFGFVGPDGAGKSTLMRILAGVMTFKGEMNVLGFKYPAEHISRTTLYTFEETMGLATHLQAKKVVFVHLEEYWNRSYDDYCTLELKDQRIRFAYDGMQLEV